MKNIVILTFLLIFICGCSLSNTKNENTVTYVTDDKLNSIYKGLVAKENGEYKKAFDIFEREAKRGNDYAMYELGVCYMSGVGVSKDYKMALYYFNQAGYNLNPKGLIAAGQMHENGLGVKKDAKKAIKYYELATRMNEPSAFYYLAALYFDMGDIKNAKIYFQNACIKGVKEACERIKY